MMDSINTLAVDWSWVVGNGGNWWVLKMSGGHQSWVARGKWWMLEANGGCQKLSGTQWWLLEPSNTTIFTNTPKIWLGLQILPELTGGHRRQVVGARGKHWRQVLKESGECWSQSSGHQSQVVVVRGEGWMPEVQGRHWNQVVGIRAVKHNNVHCHSQISCSWVLSARGGGHWSQMVDAGGEWQVKDASGGHWSWLEVARAIKDNIFPCHSMNMAQLVHVTGVDWWVPECWKQVLDIKLTGGCWKQIVGIRARVEWWEWITGGK